MKKFKNLKDYKPKEKEGTLIRIREYFKEGYYIDEIYRYEKVPILGLIMIDINKKDHAYISIISKWEAGDHVDRYKVLWKYVSKDEMMAYL